MMDCFLRQSPGRTQIARAYVLSHNCSFVIFLSTYLGPKSATLDSPLILSHRFARAWARWRE